jgi:glycosyltransferase involved in cell wall biosynthesis
MHDISPVITPSGPAGAGPGGVKVSVLMTAYNQEKFIAEALNSVLMQQVDFNYEAVVSEDFSSDRTRQIVLELEQKSAGIIRVLSRDQATAERDRANGVGGKTAFVEGFRACRGQYIALLDGDDYWTSSHKLQKQVEFLDSHLDYAICFHNAIIVSKDGSSTGKEFCLPGQKETTTVTDLIKGNYMFTGSVVFRRGLFTEFPEWFFSARIGDWPVHILNAQHGNIGYLNEVMAAYRVHDDNWWSWEPSAQKLLEEIRLLDHVNAYLGFKYNQLIKETQSKSYGEMAEVAYQKGDFASAGSLLEKSVRVGLSIHRLPSAQQLGRLLKLRLRYPRARPV